MIEETQNMTIISYGGGVQSTAMLVMAARGDLAVDAVLFSNVGDDSEDPLTLAYVRDVATPFAAKHGLDLQMLSKRKRDGTVGTLWAQLMRKDSRSLPIPIRMSNGAPGRRSCTSDYKIKVITKWLKAHGATRENKATVLIGISWDEAAMRLGKRHEVPCEVVEYPLVDRRLTREDCKRIIESAGLPVPPKSSCFFCPFHRPVVFAQMRRDRPALFKRAVTLEATLNTRRDMLGKDHVYLTRFAKPLPEAVAAADPVLDFGGPGETCDDGYCWT